MSNGILQVLLVDDDPACLEALRRDLSAFPYVAIAGEARNTSDAIALLQGGTADLAFLDIELGSESGFRLARHIHAAFPACKVIFLIGHVDFALEGYEYGPVDFLVKPTNLLRLEQALLRVRSQPVREDDARIGIQSGNRLEIVTVRKILYMEKKGRQVILACENGGGDRHPGDPSEAGARLPAPRLLPLPPVLPDCPAPGAERFAGRVEAILQPASGGYGGAHSPQPGQGRGAAAPADGERAGNLLTGKEAPLCRSCCRRRCGRIYSFFCRSRRCGACRAGSCAAAALAEAPRPAGAACAGAVCLLFRPRPCYIAAASLLAGLFMGLYLLIYQYLLAAGGGFFPASCFLYLLDLLVLASAGRCCRFGAALLPDATALPVVSDREQRRRLRVSLLYICAALILADLWVIFALAALGQLTGWLRTALVPLTAALSALLLGCVRRMAFGAVERIEALVDKQYQNDLLSFMQVIRSQRHDFNFHMRTISALVGQKQYAACDEYVRQMVESTAVMNDMLPLRHPATSAMIHAFWEMALQRGIAFEVDISSDLAQMPCTVYETNTVIGNLLQNAILRKICSSGTEAAAGLQPDMRRKRSVFMRPF